MAATSFIWHSIDVSVQDIIRDVDNRSPASDAISIYLTEFVYIGDTPYLEKDNPAVGDPRRMADPDQGSHLE